MIVYLPSDLKQWATNLRNKSLKLWSRIDLPYSNSLGFVPGIENWKKYKCLFWPKQLWALNKCYWNKWEDAVSHICFCSICCLFVGTALPLWQLHLNSFCICISSRRLQQSTWILKKVFRFIYPSHSPFSIFSLSSPLFLLQHYILFPIPCRISSSPNPLIAT